MIEYHKILNAVSLYANSNDNDTKAVNKIIYDITAIRKDANKWTLTINAHKMDGTGNPFNNTQVVSNFNLSRKLSQIGSLMDHYYVFMRKGHIDEHGNIVFDSDTEDKYDIGLRGKQ